MTAPRLFTIAAGAAFLDRLASGILARSHDDPLSLARITVLLPNRRACRSLREAFLRVGGGEAMLLPRIEPLGDLDADALAVEQEELPGIGRSLDLAPAISGAQRQALLTRLVLARDDLALAPDQAAWLAADLGRLIDRVHTEGLGFDNLATLVPDDLADHWRLTLDFLKIVSEAWPAILRDRGVVDAAERRNRILRAQAEIWSSCPPEDPVIAAGSTGSVPATRDLLAVIARMPDGVVVLPGLDRTLDDESWAELEETHPQYGLKRLLSRIDVDRHDVLDWPAPEPPGRGAPDRSALIRETMRPAATTEAWRTAGPADRLAIDGLERIDCPTPREEAAVIALIMRQTLEIPERTAALVTPDRALARRTAAALRRWDIEVDDSGGSRLADTPVGAFLILTADCAAQSGAPLAVLELLKHPLSAGGQSPADFRRAVRGLERAVLRGPRPGGGLDGLQRAIAAAPSNRFDKPENRERLSDWLRDWGEAATPFFDLVAGRAPPGELLAAHGALAERLAATDGEPGPARLWRHEDGEAAALAFSELASALDAFPVIEGRRYPEFLRAFLADTMVRPRYGRHPRLAILGPLEARLQQADAVILGGLNEGTWPPHPQVDPWMSRPMRREFGLPSPERRIGLAAHDFAQLLAAERVVLTRSERVDGSPTVPSRWLLRLDAVLDGVGAGSLSDAAAGPWQGWVRALDAPPSVQPISPPDPRPPVALRPRRLSVTEVGTWMVDPYAIYARHVLRLEPLDAIDADPGAADRGSMIHAALHQFIEEHPGPLPKDALERLLAAGRQAFGALLAYPGVRAFWWPRFVRIGQWFVEAEHKRRPASLPLAGEVRGNLELAGREGRFILAARADRIDRRADGRLAIIDYKTGQIPPRAQMERGYDPQLPLEAVIAMAGGFTGIAAAPVAELSFWRLTGGRQPGREHAIKPEDIDLLADAALRGLESLVALFDDPATPYLSRPRADRVPRFGDYDHLARVHEWSAGPGESQA